MKFKIEYLPLRYHNGNSIVIAAGAYTIYVQGAEKDWHTIGNANDRKTADEIVELWIADPTFVAVFDR